MSTALPEGIDFVDPDLYSQRIPVEEFAALRRSAPVWWNAQPGGSGFGDDGFWVISRHADVKAISTAREGWSSEENTAIIHYASDVGAEDRAAQRVLLINMDPPHHTQVRNIVARAFTPKAIGMLETALRDRADKIVAEARAKGEGDFVTDIAAELPLQAIADLLGVPQEDRHKIFHWSNEMIGADDPEFEVDPQTAAVELLAYAYAMGDDRRQNPVDDIVTKLVQADIDGEHLSPEEFGYFFLILAVAGNETTRNATTHGMKAFFDHPEQWERFKAERPATTADEIIRWATPVTAFQRTATHDHELGGETIKAGQRVGLFYGSANFDEAVFADPYKFDIGRNPNPHVGFGGGGVHYCIGASLARLEINLIFNAVADQLPDIAPLGEPRRLRSPWLNGVKEMPVRFA